MTHIRQICDFELDFLTELLTMLDRQLERLDAEAAQHDDPDGFGLFDAVEERIAIGFVAAQIYVTAVIGPGESAYKRQRRGLGPRYGEFSIAQIVHAGGNYVKHHAENLDNAETIQILVQLDVWKRDPALRTSAHDYPITNLLATIVRPPPRLSSLLPLLRTWRDALFARD